MRNQLQRITLERNGQFIVLQGMRHVASLKFYRFVQKSIGVYRKNGYLVFHEGVHGKKSTLKKLGPGDRLIGDTLVSLINLYPSMAAEFGQVLEREHVRYRKDAIRADMDLVAVIKLLQSAGFKSHPKVIECLKKAKRDGGFGTRSLLRRLVRLAILCPLLITAFVFLYFPVIKPFIKVLLHERNRLAMEIVLGELARKKKNAFVTYGNAHLKGVVKILKFHGWKVLKCKNVRI